MLSWLRRWLGLDARAPSAEPSVPSDPIEEIREQIRKDVANGFLDEDAILQSAHDMLEDEIDGTLIRREAPRLLREVLAEHAAAESAWPQTTDCERLDAAFAALEADGVISRQNFSCCGTCGSNEIWDEIKDAQDSGRPARGYAFFHMQDTESAVDGYGLYLNYGACDDTDEAAEAVGRDIVAKLQAHGLPTEWNGSVTKRIGVPLDWKKRRVRAWPEKFST